jgi:flagellar hook-associated protein 3 FlgL
MTSSQLPAGAKIQGGAPNPAGAQSASVGSVPAHHSTVRPATGAHGAPELEATAAGAGRALVPSPRKPVEAESEPGFGPLVARLADYSTGAVNTQQATSDTSALSTALNFVSQQRVTVDNSITQISAASGAVTNEQTQLTAAQTDLMQADIPTISTQLSQAETQQTALEDVIAELESTSNSLFSKLQG